jgi:hypothetical protein
MNPLTLDPLGGHPAGLLKEPGDAVIRVTTANICGSDLHPYEGRVPLEAGMVLGHQNTGIVGETGPGVNRVKVGDQVSVPFNLACGNCVEGWTSACLRANLSGQPGAGYGYPQMGPVPGRPGGVPARALGERHLAPSARWESPAHGPPSWHMNALGSHRSIPCLPVSFAPDSEPSPVRMGPTEWPGTWRG